MSADRSIERRTRPWRVGVAAAITAMAPFPQEAGAISCLTGPFFVFFDWNEDEITAPARAILDTAASAYGNCGISGRIEIDGYADRSGSGPYNFSLSRRRAEKVRAYLIERGLAEQDMIVRTFGESGRIIETPDGVQKAENRRVEFSFKLPRR